VPTPHGDVMVSWTLGDDRLQLDVTIPTGAEADVTAPVARFEQPVTTLNGRKAEPVVHVSAGTYHLEVAGKFKPLPKEVEAKTSNDADAGVVKDDLLHRFLAHAEDHCSHTGGSVDANALFNGTTRNGSGGEDTLDDGKTFRGYGNGDWLVLSLKQPCDLTEIRTFAGHGDARASQNYQVFVAYAKEPGKFVKLASGHKQCAGGQSELRLPVNAERVSAVRFEFEDGPLGFDVYREINLVGKPAGQGRSP